MCASFYRRLGKKSNPNIKITVNITLDILILKGTDQQAFGPTGFFHHSNPPGPLINGLKIFSISQSHSILSAKKLTPQGITGGRKSCWTVPLNLVL